MRAVERWLAFLKKWLPYNATAMIVLGLLLGQVAQPQAHGYGRITDAAILTFVFLMVFPMMVMLRLEAFRQASRNLKAVGLCIVYNFLWAPLAGFLLATTFIDQSEVSFGFLLVMTVPCSSMSIGYTGLTKGNVELATINVAVSYILTLVAVPIWLGLLAGRFDVPVPYLLLGRALVIMLVVPMVFGNLTRRTLIRRYGPDGFAKLASIFPAISMTSMLGSIFTIFFSMASTLLAQWTVMLWLMVPNFLFMGATFLLVTVVNRLLGIGYADNMAIAFVGTGKNNATAVAIAAATFSPLVAVPAATLPIFQIIFMIGYLRLAPQLASFFGGATSRDDRSRSDG